MTDLESYDSPLISIDFGSAFTKISFRKSSGKQPDDYDFGTAFAKTSCRILNLDDSVNLIDLNHKFDPDSLCIPTIVACADGVNWYSGSENLDLVESERVKVYKNWKSDLFDRTGDAGLRTSDLEHAVQFFIWLRKYVDAYSNRSYAVDGFCTLNARRQWRNMGNMAIARQI